jgi:hypothetical protein
MRMSINGQVNLVTDPTSFFTSVLLGATPQPPTWKPSPLSFVVTLVGTSLLPFVTTSISTDSKVADGTFVLDGFPPGLPMEEVAISLKLGHTQFFRTEFFNVSALDQPINLFLYQPRVPTSNAITAGQISENLKGSGLPGNTKLTSNASGLSVEGSKKGADIQFGVSIVPDTSFNLSLFVDLALNGWNIHVGWPADLCESANDVLKTIRKSLQTSGTSVNAAVLSNIESALTSPPENLSSELAATLLGLISTQFTSVTILNNYTWPLKDTTDGTLILFAQPVFGFPRRFDAE